MCSGSEAGSHSRLIDFVHHSTLGMRVIKKKPRGRLAQILDGGSFGQEPAAGWRGGNFWVYDLDCGISGYRVSGSLCLAVPGFVVPGITGAPRS